MAYDQNTRNRLQRFVSEARNLLTGEFTRQYQQKYGLDASSGEVSELERLVHLDDREKEIARVLRDTLTHYVASSPSGGKRECMERMIREQAFTVLNRLCALRMAEAREIIIESLSRTYNSKGFQLYARLAGAAMGETGDVYRAYIFSLFDELSLDLQVLFDRFSPHGYLFPGEKALLELLEMMNDADLSPLWVEDETIGWIYQYFNSLDERRQMRAESQAPRNSRELAVRNQFFTPRYVVEFLADNTLGRLWYEMTRGKTQLKDSCNYLVRKPQEIFLAEEEKAPEIEESSDDVSHEEMLKQAVYTPYRPLKDPREILMMDPACGSMHFGMYAFDIYEKIYEEAWDLESQLGSQAFERSETLQPLQQTYASKEELLCDVPRLIVEYNIHGVDIDPRAVQIAGLSLWLRAQRSWQYQGLKTQQRPQIRKSNVVCAEPMPGEKEMLEEFIHSLKPRVLGQLVEIIFEKMQLADEAGSLLKIEEEIDEAINLAKEEFQKEIHLRNTEGISLFPDIQSPQQANIFDFTDLTDRTRFWKFAEQKLLDALKEYAEQAEGTEAVQKRLFVQDAARGFAFIDLFRKRYDVVLMNPPFGDASITTRQYIFDQFPEGTNDICASFVIRSIGRLSKKGILGAITTRLALFIKTFTEWRKYIFSAHQFDLIADLGYGVLDAMVETAMYVIRNDKKDMLNQIGVVCLLDTQEKQTRLKELLLDGLKIEWKDPSTFLDIPSQPVAYWVPTSLLRRFATYKSFNNHGGSIRQGVATADDYRFLRLWWEVPNISNFESCWIPFAKGGEYSPWWDDIHLVVKWNENGKEIRNFFDSKGKLRSRPQNIDCFFKEGATYPYRTTSALGMRYMPPGSGFSVGGWGVYPPKTHNLFEVLAIYNTRIARYFLEVLLGQGDASASGTAARNHGSEVVGGIPWPEKRLSKSAQESVKTLIRIWLRLTSDETYLHFDVGRIFRRMGDDYSFQDLFAASWQEKCKNWLKISGLYKTIESEVVEAYQLSKNELLAIEEAEGHSLFKYNDKNVPTEDLVVLFNSSVEALIDYSKTHLGAKRYVVKKAYFIDRVIDMACHIYKASTKSVIEAAMKINPSEIGYNRTNVIEYLCWVVGICLGRWDIRYATGQKKSLELPDPFAPLPVCPPGMLQNAKGLPASPQDVSDDYPLRISWSGILVDEEGQPEDIVVRMREAIEVIWKEKAEDIEQEACEILGVDTLRDYFRKPGSFFAEHLKRYSKSRRQAPIYWPLSTASGSYTIWLYYQRLNDQTLYRCMNDFVDPKLKKVNDSIRQLRQKNGRSHQEEKELEELVNLEQEMQEFRDELLRVAPFWKPNLNDGVQITAAPLWKLFRLPKWRKTLKETWEKLEKGDYDWAHLAYSIWPERVREKSKQDKSLAIAHDLENIYEESVAKIKKKDSQGKKNT